MAGIAGFSLYNDLSVRDWQMRASQWIPGKNFAGVGAFGPSLVTPDEIADLPSVRLSTTVNGEVMQDAQVSDLIFDIPSLIRYITAFTPLAPGDVIVTGTPGGVGAAMEPPRFLHPGDLVVVSATGLGELRTPVA
jgi:2-keto-4-pentenoate hydratase/2-oxohepta-3-ene-1,7-dioic acid hydratase in catechol pathway